MYRDWHRELKARRDPAAHRIPLTVPPAIFAPDQFDQYETLEGEIQEAVGSHDFARADRLRAEQCNIGTFNFFSIILMKVLIRFTQ